MIVLSGGDLQSDEVMILHERVEDRRGMQSTSKLISIPGESSNDDQAQAMGCLAQMRRLTAVVQGCCGPGTKFKT
jgi:hypothetical protein